MSKEYAPLVFDSSIKPVPLENLKLSCHHESFIPSWLFKNLKSIGIKEWFPIQQIILPRLLKCKNELCNNFKSTGDLVTNAPTGSGKTLAYAIPIVLSLSQALVRRLRGLIILPTQDLVYQVEKVFKQISLNTSLVTMTITGKSNFNREKSILGKLDKTFLGGNGDDDLKSRRPSLVDIIIATPGRLIEHIQQTPGFNLNDLEYLVLDELDRLLEEDIQEWLPFVIFSLSDNSSTKFLTSKSDTFPNPTDAIEKMPTLPFSTTLWSPNYLTQVKKLLFSATLTFNPSKLEQIKLTHPTFITLTTCLYPNACQYPSSDISENFTLKKYSTPSTLQEYMLIVPLEMKPLFIIHLVQKFHFKAVIVFTKSIESTQRLYTLLSYFKDLPLSLEYLSSQKSISQRQKIIDSFKAGEIRTLISTDSLSRGIDLPHIDAVINYDVPLKMKKYIHRVGRTARAGMIGSAYTLLTKPEAKFFKEMIKKYGKKKEIKKVKWKDSDFVSLKAAYKDILESLSKK